MKMRLFPLRYTIPAILLLGSLFVGLSSYTYNSWLARKEVLKEAENNSVYIARIRNELEYAMRRNDLARVQNLISELGADQTVIHGYFINDEHKILAATEQAKVDTLYVLPGNYSQKSLSLIPEINIQNDRLHAVYPVSLAITGNELRPTRIGYLYMEMDISSRLAETRNHIQLQALSFGGFLLVVALLSWLYFHQVIERRIRLLQNAIKTIGKGLLTARVNLKPGDELGVLAQGFNYMAEQLEQQQGHLAALQEALDEHAIVSIADTAGNITYVNDRFCSISGFTRDELLGKNHRIVKSGAHSSTFYNNLWRIISNGNIWQGVIQNTNKWGKPYWVQSTIVPMLDENLKPKQYISVRTDVTQRERIRYAMEKLATATIGSDSYDSIAHSAAIGLDCRWVGFGRLFDDDRQIQVLGFWNDGQAGEKFTYELAGTPCDQVCSYNKPLVYGENVASQFPDDQILTDLGAVCYRGEPLPDEDGKILGVLFAIDDRPCREDESERALLRMAAKRASLEIKRTDFEQTLRDNELQLASAQHMAKLGSWTLDLESNVLSWSDEVYAIFGLDKSKFTASYDAFVEAIHPDDRELVNQAYLQSVEQKTPYSIVHRLLMKNGKIKWVHERGETQYDTDGKAIRSIGYVHDITERKLMEKELQDSKERFEISQSFSNIGTFEWNIQTNQNYWSSQIWHLLGLSKNTVEPSFDVYISRVHPDDRKALQLEVMNSIETGSDVDIEYRLVWPDNSEHWVRGRAGVERDENGEAVRMLGVIMDIDTEKATEDGQKQLMRQLQQAQKMESIGQLTGGIAHDFNNILAAINGFTELSIEFYGNSSDGKLGEYLREVLQASERGRKLVSQMLTFGREQPGELVSVEVEPLIKEVSRLMSSTLPSSIDFKQDVAKDVPPVLFDPVQLHQVLTNMTINARDAAGEHGHIKLQLARPTKHEGVCSSCHQPFSGEYVEIVIEDDGHGIPADKIDRIFEPFFTTKQVGKGSGMGLAMVHGILHQSNGHVLVESKPGKGTRFRLLLPLASADNVVTNKNIDKKQVKDIKNKSIMIVDDESGVTAFLTELLGMHKYEVHAFNDPVKALEWYKENPDKPDLVITDQTMPELTGAELSQQLLTIKQSLPIILCTGYSETINEEIAKKIGIKAYMKKPVSSYELLDCVATQLQQAS